MCGKFTQWLKPAKTHLNRLRTYDLSKSMTVSTVDAMQVRCELMTGLTEFLRRRCRHLQHADLPVAAVWLTYVDRQLTGRGWQVFPFLGPSSLVFVYMLARQAVQTDVSNVDDLRTVLLACLYVAYAYIGSEISYPIKVRKCLQL